MLPKEELDRVDDEMLEKYYKQSETPGTAGAL